MSGEISDFKVARTTDVQRKMNEGKPILGFRWILVILGFILSFLEFFVRNSFPVALVAMVNSTESDDVDKNLTSDTCITGTNNITNETSTPQNTEGEFSWDSQEQGIILGGFFWGFMCSKLIASRICEIVGQREVIAVGTATCGLLSLFGPFAASIHPYALAAVRFLSGACYGPAPGAMHSLLSAWAPRDELSSMFTTIQSGLAVGGMAGLAVAGWLTALSGWQTIFWISAAVNFIFVPFWLTLVRNSPQKHPWISSYEANLLAGNKNVTTQKTVPWRKLIFSPFVIICTACHFARTVIDVVLTTEGPSFFTYKIGLKLSTASYVSAGTYLASVVFVLIFGRISDFLIRHEYLSKVHTRKFFHFIGCCGGSMMLIGVVFAGCDSTTVIILWVFIGGIFAATLCSYLVSIIDFAPNYAATVIGVTGLGNLGGALTPLVTSVLLSQKNGWNKTFYMASGMNLLSCLIYVPFMTAEAQSWNYPEEE